MQPGLRQRSGRGLSWIDPLALKHIRPHDWEPGDVMLRDGEAQAPGEERVTMGGAEAGATWPHSKELAGVSKTTHLPPPPQASEGPGPVTSCFWMSSLQKWKRIAFVFHPRWWCLCPRKGIPHLTWKDSVQPQSSGDPGVRPFHPPGPSTLHTTPAANSALQSSMLWALPGKKMPSTPSPSAKIQNLTPRPWRYFAQG